MYALRVTTAAACAALIGAALSLYYLPAGFWWAGAIAGGALGYVGYDPKHFLQNASSAIASAWREMTRKREREPKPVYPAWAKRAARWDRFAFLMAWSSAIGALSLVVMLMHYFNPDKGEVHLTIVQTLASYPLGVGLGVPLAMMLSLLMADGVAKNNQRGERAAIESIAESKKIALLANPIVAPFALVYAVFFLAIPWVVKFIARACVKTCEFTTSNGRIATLIGGSMGAAAGYFLGNPLMGALVGGGIGLTLALMRPRSARVKS